MQHGQAHTHTLEMSADTLAAPSEVLLAVRMRPCSAPRVCTFWLQSSLLWAPPGFRSTSATLRPLREGAPVPEPALTLLPGVPLAFPLSPWPLDDPAGEAPGWLAAAEPLWCAGGVLGGP